MPAIYKFISLFLLIAASFELNGQDNQLTYYLSPSGNDNNDGHSPKRAWKTLAKLNSVDLRPGSHVFLEKGKTFTGTIKLDKADSGTPSEPVTISSYPKEAATIDAGDSTGLYGINCSNIVVSNINFKGNGVGKNSGSGIFFYSDLQTNQPENITILYCSTSGFGKYGILFGSAEGGQIKGFNKVMLEECRSSANGEAGIGSYGDQSHFPHTNFLVNQCYVHGNRGILTKTENHSGNGIVFGSVENITIQYCKAFDNGADNRCNAGGPVGIWVWLCKNAVIQYCESHHNHAGAGKDGGGFDIDGGSSNCVIQFNYSHDNEGAGYLLAEYGAATPFVNDTIRFNISENDGRKNSYGGITIWGVSNQYQVRKSIVYNNTVFVSTNNIVNGNPCAVQIIGPNMSGVILANNIFLTQGTVEFVNSSDAIDTSNIKFISNSYYSYSNRPSFIWNRKVYRGLSEWKSFAKGQETFNGMQTGVYIDPQLDSAQTSFQRFRLSKTSPIKYGGTKLSDLGVTGYSQDIFSRKIANNGMVNPGASN
ncbi:MAG: hypothetical protein C5B52_15700 [Bacteroidetes bacterium]|nr:MAG: hypothetical protein C5B52_15700 [Bacteroidota bacterium]